MNKKTATIMFVAFCSNMLIQPTSMAIFGGGGMFGDLFKNLDFDKLAKDMESILQEIDETPQGPSAPVKSKPMSKPYTEPSAPTKNIEPQILKTDRKSLFLDSLVVEQNKHDPRAKATYTFPKIKEDAYNYYLSKLVNGLKSIEKKIDSSRLFSPAFKEAFIGYKKHIDDIVVSDGIISDRRLYLRAFFLPQFNPFREKIFNIIPALEQLDSRVALAVKNEKINDSTSHKALTELAQKPKAIIKKTPTKAGKGGTRKGSQKSTSMIKKNEGKSQQHELELLPTKKPLEPKIAEDKS